jgi:hypothetical protein
MWAEDVMIAEEQSLEQKLANEAMLKKSVAMALAYAVTAWILWQALSILGLDSRLWRGEVLALALWTCHVDAASWRAWRLAKSSAYGRNLMLVAEAFSTRRWMAWSLAAVPLISGFLAVEWWRLAPRIAIERAVVGGYAWLLALGIFGAWISLIDPRALALAESHLGGKASRAWHAAKASLLALAEIAALWAMLCKALGWH